MENIDEPQQCVEPSNTGLSFKEEALDQSIERSRDFLLSIQNREGYWVDELEPVTITEIKDEKKDIEFARENIYSTLTAPFEFPDDNVLVSLSGRIDKIMRIDGTLIVQDDKFAGRPQVYDSKTRPYPSQLLQVLTYLNSTYSAKRGNNPDDIFEMPHTEKQWQIRICDRKTREPYKIYSEIQDAFSMHFLVSSLKKFAGIALNIDEPTHHNSVPKCNACNLKNSCEFRL